MFKNDSTNIESTRVGDGKNAQADASFASKIVRFFTNNKTLALTAIVVLLVAGFTAVVLMNNGSELANETEQPENTGPAELMGVAITYAEGKVEVGDGENWDTADSGTQPTEGQQVRTGADSRTILTLDDGSAVRLNANTRVILTRLADQEIVITNVVGQVYSRVTPSESRTFAVEADNETYRALGTAYLTVNTQNEAGVEVYQSKVKAVSANKEVTQSKAYYTKNTAKNKVKKVTDVNLKQLRNNEFVEWNSEQDKEVSEFSEKLGVLTVFDKPQNKKDNEPEPEPIVSSGITLTGVASDSAIKLSWTVPDGLDVSNGFKVVKAKDSTPLYGEHDSRYLESSTRSYAWKLQDGATYNFRVCVYQPNRSSCNNYSNTVSVKSIYKEPVKVESGEITTSLDGNVLSWTITGTAPHGYKVVYNEAGNPKYGKDKALTYTQDKKATIKGLPTGTYYFSVCKYTNGTQAEACVDYSDEVIYVVN